MQIHILCTETSWVAWSVSDKKETCSVLEPAATSKGKWKDGVIKEWGRIAKEFLANYAGKKL